MKFFIILLIITGVILIGLYSILNKIRSSFLNIFSPNKANKEGKNNDVIYKNENVVVLKGEAKDKKKEKD